MVKDRDIVEGKTNRKSYVAYQMAPLSMPLNDLEGHFCCLKPFQLPYLVKHGMNLLTLRVAPTRGPSVVAELPVWETVWEKN